MVNENVIPEQKEGAATHTSSSCTCNDALSAKTFFETVKQRLFDVNHWEKIAGMASADFRLCDSDGNEVNRELQKGDHFKIDIPGPGPDTGDGYDWVKVEAIDAQNQDDEEQISITVRPATNPNNDNKDVAHFFKDTATSSFVIERKGNKVTASVIGRNEKPNADAEKITDKARNTAVAAAAITGFSKIQWKGLVDGLIKD